jgi:hypothetical protein
MAQPFYFALGGAEGIMEQTLELRRAILREEIRLTRLMMEAGYYPYKINFINGGDIMMEARERDDEDDHDKKILDEMVKRLEDYDGGPACTPHC